MEGGGGGGVPSDLSSVCFYDGVWINSYGPPGDAPSVLAYLRQSPFWDAGSANEALMQRGARDPSDEAELARLAPRTEFVVAEARPPHLFVVQKRRRDAPGARPTLLMQLYVLDGVAYMCPSAGAVVGARVSRAAYRLEKALELFTAEAYADPKEAATVDAPRTQRPAREEADTVADAAAALDFALAAARDAPPPRSRAEADEHARVGALLSSALTAAEARWGERDSAAAGASAEA
uniref:Mediator of RNA polymerase II transcription subunit 6 n=1 Tax=Prasinoderma coloniale TaxID=156133 RepID=A0A7R9TZ91_9VIRI